MKKALIVTITLLMILTAIPGDSLEFGADGGQTTTPVPLAPGVPSTEADPAEAADPIARLQEEHITFTAPSVTVDGDYSWVIMPGCDPFTLPGAPALPVSTWTTVLPYGSSVESVEAS